MTILRHLFILISIVLLAGTANAKRSQQNFYRDFWQPMYHGQLLAYCTMDGKECGREVANRYCKIMGYEHADQEIIAHNVGLTNYIATKAGCKGWKCNGFETIRCVGNISHKPPDAYYYRSRRFVYPRFNNYRVAWCYKDNKDCGRRVAYSFCRRMGYMREKGYKKQENVGATKALGNQKLCFGKSCDAFESISCYR